MAADLAADVSVQDPVEVLKDLVPESVANSGPAVDASALPEVRVDSGVGTADSSGLPKDPLPIEGAATEPKMAASAPPPPENSTLALVWKPGQIERLPPTEAKAPDYDVVATSSLGNYVGKRVQLITTGGKRVDGDVHMVNAANLVLLVQVGRGSAELNVPLGNIREARLIRPRPAESR
jgi:hypothetical protein